MEREQDIGRLNVKLGHARAGNLDLHALFRKAPELDAANLIDEQELLLEFARALNEFGVGKSVRSEREYATVNVAKVVFYDGRQRFDRKRRFDRRHLIAQFLPRLRHRFFFRLLEQVDENDRKARLGNRANLLEILNLLRGALDDVRYALFNFVRRRARTHRYDDRRLNSELGILQPSEREIRPYPAQND